MRDSESVLFAVIGASREHGKLAPDDFVDKQLARAEQSVARLNFTSKPNFIEHVAGGSVPTNRAIAMALARDLRDIPGIVAQIDNLEIGVNALFGDIEQPIGRDIREPSRTGRADDDSDFGSLLHRRFPRHSLVVSNDMGVTEKGTRRHFF